MEPTLSQEKSKGIDHKGVKGFYNGLDDADGCNSDQYRTEVGKPDENKAIESYDYSTSSLDIIFQQISTPNLSQVDLSNRSREESTAPTSIAASQATNDLTQASARTELKTGVDQGSALHHLPFGVKFFLVAFVPNFTFVKSPTLKNLSTIEVLEKCLQALPSNMQPEVNSYITSELLQACEELDRERNLLENGEQYLHDEKEEWIGGKVSFSGRLEVEKNGEVGIRLLPFCVKTSSRYTRRFGSERFLCLKMPENRNNQERNALKEYLRQPVTILDRQFHLIFIKDDSAHLFELRNDIATLWDFFDWHGPWQDNRKGKLLKHIQRLTLGLSTSIPGPMIPADKVRSVEDIVSRDGKVMTDGAAPVSLAVMIKIATLLKMDSIPTAVQGRYDGAKGMWYLSPDEVRVETEKDLWIGIRDSQLKLKRSITTQTCHQILDVVQVARVTTPSSLSTQTLTIIAHNGVPLRTLLQMQKEQLQEVVDNLTGREGEIKDRLEMAACIYEAGSILMTRLKRDPSHLATASTLVGAGRRKELTDDTDEDRVDTLSSPYYSCFEKAYDMLLAGFEVHKSETLMKHMIKSAGTVLDRAVKKFQIGVQRSAEAFVIPDPLGVLREGEIQFRFGRKAPVDPTTKIRLANLSGDVLAARHPCLLPTDKRKVKAVMSPRLAYLDDVIIVSTKGDSPLADMLSGGDYDGDTIRVFWDPSIVQPFRNVDPHNCQPSITISEVFDQDQETVEEFLSGSTNEDQNNRLREMILAPLGSDTKCIYGSLQKCAAYMYGTGSQQAIDLAFKFNNSMDGVKTGLLIKKEVLRADKLAFDRTLPIWADKNPGVLRENNVAPNAKRPSRLGAFILDSLWANGQKTVDIIKKRLDERKAQPFQRDEEIASVWEEVIYKNRISALQREVIKNHCKDVLKMHQKASSEYVKQRDTTKNSPRKRQRTTPSSPQFDGCTLKEIPHHYEAWIKDNVKAFEIAGLEPPDKDEQTSLFEDLCEGEIERLRQLLASCLYIEAHKKYRIDEHSPKEYIAFDIAGSHLLNLKAGKNEEKATLVLSKRTASKLRLCRVAGKSS